MKTLKRIKTGVVTVALMGSPLLAMAQTNPGSVTGLTSVGGVLGLFLAILGLVTTIFWIVAVAMILYAAFLYLTAGGSDDKVATANKTLFRAVIAIVIALVATSIPYLVRSVLGGGA